MASAPRKTGIICHIASLDLPHEFIERYASLLSAEERKRAQEFRTDELRRRYVASHGIIREILGEALETPAVEIDVTERGKPFLKNGALKFNMSHADDVMIVACSPSVDVGVDVEPIRPMDDPDGIVRRFFAPREWIEYSHIESDERLHSFFAAWTRKEAVLKLTGDGIAHRMRTVAVTVDHRTAPKVVECPEDFGACESFAIRDIADLQPGFAAAVAARCPLLDVDVRRHHTWREAASTPRGR